MNIPVNNVHYVAALFQMIFNTSVKTNLSKSYTIFSATIGQWNISSLSAAMCLTVFLPI